MRCGWVLLVLLAGVAVGACGGDGGDDVGTGPAWVGQISEAIAAVEAELGGPQEYFEVTATPQLTNVFVAVDDATAAIPYVYLDGELQLPGPTVSGAVGQTFRARDVDIDPDRVLTGVQGQLPEATIDALSVEGGPGTSVRYVVSARSAQGGVLDVVVMGGGAVVSVDFL